jgi:hypothetical protein
VPLRFRAFEVLESVCFKWFGALERDGSDVGVAAVEISVPMERADRVVRSEPCKREVRDACVAGGVPG